MFPKIRRVIMRCDCYGDLYQDGAGRVPEFETKAILLTWLGFYTAFTYGEVTHANHRADWGLK